MAIQLQRRHKLRAALTHKESYAALRRADHEKTHVGGAGQREERHVERVRTSKIERLHTLELSTKPPYMHFAVRATAHKHDRVAVVLHTECADSARVRFFDDRRTLK